ncbi:MAG: SBBP repeat-containing protein, partial [Bacteroidetes bacterium]|nr:SBBP repeat-containing protein [Bacteroidota bacterium]
MKTIILSPSRLLFLLTFIYFSGENQALSQNFSFAKSMGGFDTDFGKAITTDHSGNVYTTGFFQGTVDFDPDSGVFELTSAGFYDIFVSKLDATGKLVWAVRMGGKGFEQGYGIVLDDLGNVYITGDFTDTADFDPSPLPVNLASAGANDIFISKLDPDGNFVWAKRIGGPGNDYASAIVIDHLGNIYTTGEFWQTVDFNPDGGVFEITTSAGRGEAFVLKLDVTGSFVWAKSMGGDDDTEGLAIAVDSLQNVYTTGSFEGTVDFGQFTFTCAGGTYPDIFISKLNVSGEFVWAKAFGDTNDDVGKGIAVDDSGHVYVTGEFYGIIDFGSMPGLGRLDAGISRSNFILKLDQFGGFVWANRFGTGSGDGIALDGSHNVYTIGDFSGTADFDPGIGTFELTSQGSTFISKLDAGGSFVWAFNYEGPGSTIGMGIAVDGSENVYTTGAFSDSIDFNPDPVGKFSLAPVGSFDIFVSKFQPFPLDIQEIPSQRLFSIYPNPSNGQIHIEADASLIRSAYSLFDHS